MAMKIYRGEIGRERSWQEEFPKKVKCVHCKGKARIIFVGQEDGPGNNVCDMRDNKGKKGGFWLHDCCAIAVYLCQDCLESTSLINQA